MNPIEALMTALLLALALLAVPLVEARTLTMNNLANRLGHEPTVEEIEAALAEPFEADEVKFRAGATSGNRALALAYVDARVIQDRLDNVLGVTGWQDEYERLPDGCVVCSLRLKIGAEWIQKVDVGGESEQPDEGDRTKAAFSDSLKRAAVKFGVGRYLYRLPAGWVDYDPQKKQLKGRPQLPLWALPQYDRALRKPEPDPKLAQDVEDKAAPLAGPAPQQTAAPPPPKDGREALERILALDAKLVEAGLARKGELSEHVDRQCLKMGLPPNPLEYTPEQIEVVMATARSFKREREAQKKAQKQSA